MTDNQVVIGNKYGHLTVIEEGPIKIGSTGKVHRQWWCECDCENKTRVLATAIKLSKRRSWHCGCDPIEVSRTDIVGQRFNRLVVEERAGSKEGKTGTKYILWKCKCDCGNIVYASTSDLRSGHTGSCGCYFRDCMKERGIANRTQNTYDLDSYDYGVGYLYDGTEFKFDKEDFEKIFQYRWNRGGYKHLQAHDNDNGRRTIFMHRIIMNVDGEDWIDCQVDHINHDTFDNRKSNLRITTCRQNGLNKAPQKNNTSGVSGVLFHKITGKYQCRINVAKNKRIVIGLYDNFIDAVRARIEAETKIYGDHMYKGNLNILKYIDSGGVFEYGDVELIEKIRKGDIAA